MWRKGNKRFGGGGEPPAKRQAAGEDGPSESADDGIVVAQISKSRRVAVRNWNGKVVVDIREFYEKDGKSLPSRKGISNLRLPSFPYSYSVGFPLDVNSTRLLLLWPHFVLSRGHKSHLAFELIITYSHITYSHV
ncbi:hypothetical protein GUJ93_ZPchr0002g23169 [Zizania palustris]|uniref:Transcriptional coactivator p15 (PC4) C-terminal domain-containing protein n=1 Tax=Zizania palustris TaxID=103762 RepID=A0A8J5SPF5_ZIZPA|nr:hypothetical protein GUJ93_ZPchr0002g23169 [Zizania palustris]